MGSAGWLAAMGDHQILVFICIVCKFGMSDDQIVFLHIIFSVCGMSKHQHLTFTLYFCICLYFDTLWRRRAPRPARLAGLPPWKITTPLFLLGIVGDVGMSDDQNLIILYFWYVWHV